MLQIHDQRYKNVYAIDTQCFKHSDPYVFITVNITFGKKVTFNLIRKQ